MNFNKCTEPSKCNLPGFNKNLDSLCTAENKYNIVDKYKLEIPHNLCSECCTLYTEIPLVRS